MEQWNWWDSGPLVYCINKHSNVVPLQMINIHSFSFTPLYLNNFWKVCLKDREKSWTFSWLSWYQGRLKLIYLMSFSIQQDLFFLVKDYMQSTENNVPGLQTPGNNMGFEFQKTCLNQNMKKVICIIFACPWDVTILWHLNFFTFLFDRA